MPHRTKRLRIFAGPNGSGKSTLYNYLVSIGAFHSYYFINADQMTKDLATSINLAYWPIEFSETELCSFLDGSSFQSCLNFRLSEQLIVRDSVVSLKNPEFADTTYLSAALAEFLRHKMFVADSSFCFETVFSHPSKVEEIREAQKAGCKIYLYFIATSDPSMNQKRVLNRVEEGGHSVPADKILERYYRCLDLLYDTLLLSDRAFLFDNSGVNQSRSYSFFVEKKGGQLTIPGNVPVPSWFNKYILQKLPK
ncbi:hypothetical protein AGMMS49938_03580 [Fibrobacterales bacterium]|nr:hypothetical protein AGMMS49938_03580 [Fibrobacterales bacterium]